MAKSSANAWVPRPWRPTRPPRRCSGHCAFCCPRFLTSCAGPRWTSSWPGQSSTGARTDCPPPGRSSTRTTCRGDKPSRPDYHRSSVRGQLPMYIYRLVLLLVIGIYLFSPAIMDWWIEPTRAWYRPHVLSLILIIAGMLLQSPRDTDELCTQPADTAQRPLPRPAVQRGLGHRAGPLAAFSGAPPGHLHPVDWR